jgi:uncharacterized membrane protein
MNDLAIARAIHVFAVVIWIGGLAMVTTVILPMVLRARSGEGQRLLKAVERRFIWQARVATLVVTWQIGSDSGTAFAALSSGGCTPWFSFG